MILKMRLLPILLLSAIGLVESFELPKGWKMPVDSSFNGAWRRASPSRYLGMSLDINCDGFADSILILQPAKGLGMGVFAFLQGKNGAYKSVQIFDSRKDVSDLKGRSEGEKREIERRYSSFYGIKLAERGIYPTACGQGYRPCEKGEKRKIEMECGGIDFFPSDQEGGNMDFYWDRKTKKILSAVMND